MITARGEHSAVIAVRSYTLPARRRFDFIPFFQIFKKKRTSPPPDPLTASGRAAVVYIYIMQEMTEYQRRAANFLWRNSNACLSIGMGLGKTRIVLEFLQYAMQVYPHFRALIIAPKRVAQTVWRQEAAKWELSISDDMVLIDGTAAQKKKIAEGPERIKIVSRDNLDYITDQHFNVAVLDELTSFKNITAKRTKQAMKIDADRFIGMTGTFIPNSAIDIYGQLAVLGIATDNARDYYAWRGRYFRDAFAARPVAYKKWVLQDGVELDDILQEWRDHIFVLSSDDYLQLPPIQYHNIEYDMHADEVRAYEDAKAFLHFSMPSGLDFSLDEKAKFIKLQSLASGFVYDEDKAAQWITTGTPSRISQACDFLERAKNEGERVLIFYQYTATAIRIHEEAQVRGINIISLSSPQWQQQWETGNADALIIQPQAGAHGLNLQAGGHIVLWLELTYNYELYAQANARLHRRGQLQPVRVFHLVASGTTDSAVLDALKKKDDQNKYFEKKFKR